MTLIYLIASKKASKQASNPWDYGYSPNVRSKIAVRSIDVVRGHNEDMALLRAVEAGDVVRGLGGETSIFAEHLWNSQNVRLHLVRLSKDELVELPISGPPRLTPRGRRTLSEDPPPGR